VLKRHRFMVRVVRKPVPYRRFQRRLVDLLWQVDVYKCRTPFKIRPIWVTNFRSPSATPLKEDPPCDCGS
jgi:hypothetical protein